jgi:L-malate glycosyltransferase
MSGASQDLRVIVFTPGEIFGGAERQALTLMHALREVGVGCELIVLHDADLASRARQAGHTVYVLPNRSSFDMSAIGALRQYLDARRQHVISVHGYRASVYLGLAARPGQFQVVKTEHGHVERDHFPAFQRFKQKAYRHAENWAMRRLAARIVYVTRDLRQRCEHEHRGLDSRVIHNGIAPLSDISLARPVELEPACFNMLMVGRLEKIKGIDVAIRALRSPRMPRDARLHIVGEGVEQQSLQALANELGVREHVLFHGFRANVYDFIRYADCLLMPSLHEGLPYTVLEAMSLRTPVIASGVGGLAEVLVHEKTALLVPSQDAAALAAAIASLSSDSGLREALRRAALDEVHNKLSATAMAWAYIDVFTVPDRT